MRIVAAGVIGVVMLGACDTSSRVWQVEEVQTIVDRGTIQVQSEYGVWWNDYFGEMSHATNWLAYNNDTQPWCVHIEKVSGARNAYVNEDFGRSVFVPAGARRHLVGRVEAASDVVIPGMDLDYQTWRPPAGATNCENRPSRSN